MKKVISDIQDSLWENFLREAKNTMVSVYKQQTPLGGSACNWGGCFTGLPPHITYYYIEELLEELL